MSFIRSSAMMLVAVLSANLLAYAFHMLAGRYLGPADYGEFGIVISLFMLLGIPYTGLNMALTRSLGNAAQDGRFSQAAIGQAFARISLKTIAWFALSLLLVYALFRHRVHISSGISWWLIMLLFVFSAFYWLLSGILRGRRDYRKLAQLQIIEALGRLPLLLLLIWLAKPFVPGVLLAFACGFLLPLLFYHRELLPHLHLPRDQTEATIAQGLRNIWVLYAVLLSAKNFVLNGMTNFSVILVGQWLNPEQVGYWNAALTIARINQFAATAISAVLFAEASSTDHRQVRLDLARKAAGVFTLICLGSSLLFFTLPHWLIVPLYGSSFSEAQSYLPWIGLGTALLGYVQIWADYWLAGLDMEGLANVWKQKRLERRNTKR